MAAFMPSVLTRKRRQCANQNQLADQVVIMILKNLEQ